MAVSRSIVRAVERAILRTPQRVGGGPVNTYVQNVVNSGSNGRVVNGSSVWPNSVPRTDFIFSCWVQEIQTFAPMNLIVLGIGANATQARCAVDNPVASNTGGFRIQIGSSGETNIVDTVTDTIFTKQDLHHVLVARQASTIQVYINGVFESVTNQPNSGDIPWGTMISSQLCARVSSSFTSNYGDMWFAASEWLDFSIAANLAKFIDTNGDPVDLGLNGELPLIDDTAQLPEIFFGSTMLAADWNAGSNRGTLGGGAWSHFGADFTDV